MADGPVLTVAEDGVLSITLNRPDKLNAFTEAMIADLHTALERAGEDAAVRAIILTGAGRGFSAGQDLAADEVDLNDPDLDLGSGLERHFNPTVELMRALPKPIVGAVNGVAAGVGANIALACDIVVAARSASFLQAFARIGLVPDGGGSFFLPRLVGEARARAMALLAEPVPAETAHAWGMIWAVHDDEALMGEAKALAARLAAGPTLAYAAIKQEINASFDNTLSGQLALERALQRDMGRTADFREGVSAFLEKRKATFRGA